MNGAMACSAVTDSVGESEHEPRWPARAAFLTSWLLPATTARRTDHVSLARAWCVHITALLLTVVLIIGFVAWEDSSGLVYIPIRFVGVFVNIVDVAAQYPVWFSATVASTAAGIEGGLLFLAVLAMSWGARDERLRDSYRHALRRTWLQTTAVLPGVFVGGLLAIALFGAHSRWERANPGPNWPTSPTKPQVSPDDPASRRAQSQTEYKAAKAAYDEQVAVVSNQWRDWRARKPWYIRNPEFFIFPFCFAASLWLLWTLLRAVGARRDVVPIERPPTCEACGYNLTTIALDSRCPECGDGVISSLGSDARPGCVWELRRTIGRITAWRRCCLEVLTAPGAMGRKLCVTSPRADHRGFLLLHLAMIFVLGFFVPPIVYSFETGKSPFAEPEVIYLAGPLVACISTGGTVLLVLLVASVIGMAYSRSEKRNLLPGAMQMAAYLSPYLVLWYLFGLVSGLGVDAAENADVFRVLQDMTGIPRDLLSMLSWFLPNLVCGLVYIGLVGRGTAATRYANR